LVNRTPLKFDYDDITPSALAEFTSSDTVPIVNGGTGVSSLANFGTSLSATTVLAASISATTITSPDFVFSSTDSIIAASVSAIAVSAANFYTPDAGAFNCMGADGVAFFMKRENGGTYENLIKSDEGTITIQSEDDIHFLSNTGEKFMRLNESGGDGEVELYYNNSLKLETTDEGLTITGAVDGPTSVSATAVSGTTFNGMPYPPPFGYAQLDSDGTGNADLQNLGVGATISDTVSDSADITWDDTDKNFEVSADGIYELTSIVLLGVGGTTNVTIKAMKKRGGVISVENSVDSRVHSSIDPTETTIRAVANCLASDVLYITTVDDNTDVVTAITGSSIMVKRLQ